VHTLDARAKVAYMHLHVGDHDLAVSALALKG
jgi:hypothetical protein